METEIYETDEMGFAKVKQFERWCDKEIGTETQVNDFGEGRYTLMIFDLTYSEVKKLRKYENEGV